MSNGLLVSALCWELDSKISAEHAHNCPHLSFYCPDRSCLVRVDAAKRNNHFFRARPNPSMRGHRTGCQWEKEIADASLAPGIAHPKPSPLLGKPVPTLLGPGPAVRHRLPPTAQDLRQMAERLEVTPVVQPGTLEEIVDAWCEMDSTERRDRRLCIADREGSYADAFSFLPGNGRDIDQIESRNRIIFGAANVWVGGAYIFVTTIMKFEHMGQRIPISFKIRRTASTDETLAQYSGVSATAFWHGLVPSIDANRRYFTALVPDEVLYDGLVMKRGHLLP